MARLVPEGEVVGIDLAAGMVLSAHRAARAAGLDHCAFYQSDVGELPEEFNDQFDLVYSCLAHHHYPEPPTATQAILRCLRPGGVYCVVDPGPDWYNKISAPIAKWADPGWIGFHTPEQFRSLMQNAGFRTYRLAGNPSRFRRRNRTEGGSVALLRHGARWRTGNANSGRGP